MAILRGLLRRCPRCGGGRLYRRWYTQLEGCSACGMAYEEYAKDTWALLYLSTAGLTGVIVVGMLLLQPADLQAGRAWLVALAVTVIPATLPNRKGAAIAVNYLIGLRL